jgi:hypothetical protein
MPISRHVGDDRRAKEIGRIGVDRIFDTMPSIGQLKEGQSAIIRSTGERVFRLGNKIWKQQYTEV